MWGLIYAIIKKHKAKIQEVQKARVQYVVEKAAYKIHPHLSAILEQRYSKIRFDFITVFDIVRNFHKSEISLERDIESIIVETYRDFALKVRSDYLKACTTFNTGFRVDYSLVPSSFWENEPNNRITKNGSNPPDWSVRRLIVFHRDKGACQRCGKREVIDACHIHHITRRSQGGDHSIENLITLCKDCHTLMDGHSKMRTYRAYFISSSNKIHTRKCRFSKNAKKIIAAYPELRSKGFQPCNHCSPWQMHEKAKNSWRYEIEIFTYKTINELVKRAN